MIVARIAYFADNLQGTSTRLSPRPLASFLEMDAGQARTCIAPPPSILPGDGCSIDPTLSTVSPVTCSCDVARLV